MPLELGAISHCTAIRAPAGSESTSRSDEPTMWPAASTPRVVGTPCGVGRYGGGAPRRRGARELDAGARARREQRGEGERHVARRVDVGDRDG